jgi:hypothetical protein
MYSVGDMDEQENLISRCGREAGRALLEKYSSFRSAFVMIQLALLGKSIVTVLYQDSYNYLNYFI